jgi:hypothetical protein
MCNLRNLHPRSRRQMGMANAALMVALSLRMLAHPSGTAQVNLFDAAMGFLLGFSIIANLLVILRRRAGSGC